MGLFPMGGFNVGFYGILVTFFSAKVKPAFHFLYQRPLGANLRWIGVPFTEVKTLTLLTLRKPDKRRLHGPLGLVSRLVLQF